MTKSEALAISNMLPNAHRDIQEVHIRLKMFRTGKIDLDPKMLVDCESRLDRAIETLSLVNKMALAELS